MGLQTCTGTQRMTRGTCSVIPMTDPWVKVEEINGGLVVFCKLCGSKTTRQSFRAGDTNYAEARRLATAYHSTHRDSAMHAAALDAFHAKGAVSPPPEQALLAEVFGTPAPTEMDARRSAARTAALRVARAQH
jgi:hypothetical protein